MENNTRKTQIFNAAVKLAERDGYQHIVRRDIAVKARCAEGLINHYFKGGMTALKREVMKNAVATSNLKILAQGLVARDRVARRAPEELKREALNALLG